MREEEKNRCHEWTSKEYLTLQVQNSQLKTDKWIKNISSLK